MKCRANIWHNRSDVCTPVQQQGTRSSLQQRIRLLPSLLNKVISTEVQEEVSGQLSSKILCILYDPKDPNKEAFKA